MLHEQIKNFVLNTTICITFSVGGDAVVGWDDFAAEGDVFVVAADFAECEADVAGGLEDGSELDFELF